MKIIFIFLTLLLIFMAFLFKLNQKSVPLYHAIPRVKVVSVKAISIKSTLSVMGVLKPDQGIQLSSPIAGLIKKIYFQSGQFVQEGDLLVELSNDDLKSKFAEDLEKYRFTSRQYWRYKKLFSSGGIARADMDRLHSSLIQAKAVYELDEALLNKTLIRAPFSGRLGINRINLGQYLPAGMPMVSLYDLSQVFVDFSVPQKFYSLIKNGDTVKIINPKNLLTSYVGKILSSGVRLSSETLSQHFRAKIDGDFRALGLLPGMFVKVQIPSSESRASIFIPESAVRYSIGGEFVYVFQGGLVRRKKILLGENKEGWIQVKIGLHPTEKVLVTGFENLYDGAAVRVIK